MESSQRDLFIDMVVDMLIIKNNQIALSPRFTLISGAGLPEKEVGFYCVIRFRGEMYGRCFRRALLQRDARLILMLQFANFIYFLITP